MDSDVQAWTCAHCGASCTRAKVRGQRPKWCDRCRALAAWKIKIGTCANCGAEYEGHGLAFCSRSCSSKQRRPNAKRSTPKPTPIPTDLRSDIRKAYERGDNTALLQAIRAQCEVVNGCWLWMRKLSKGYPATSIARRQILVHRLSLEAKHGKALGSQAAHHICAQTTCVNPDHLQPVTHADNTAEMLARQSYLARIRELEDALASIEPTHPLLDRIEVA